jgi:hypothetical protein
MKVARVTGYKILVSDTEFLYFVRHLEIRTGKGAVFS